VKRCTTAGVDFNQEVRHALAVKAAAGVCRREVAARRRGRATPGPLVRARVDPVRTVVATRYVTPLREGGSLPALVEGDDQGLYVVKLRGAGQGAKALVAEWVAGELARAAGLRVPELVRVEVDPALGRNEPDGEIRDLLKASAGPNLGLDFLPGSVTFDPAVGPPPGADEAADLVFLDALVTNVDRTPRNPNLLVWHGKLWLIDHGAALYVHHDWGRGAAPGAPFPAVKDHVLLPWAGSIAAAAARLAPRLDGGVVQGIVAALPDGWLPAEPGLPDAAAHRARYLGYLTGRLAARDGFVEEADRARALLV
jgi:HipA-like kinase